MHGAPPSDDTKLSLGTNLGLSLISEGSRRRKGEQKIKRNPENRKIKGLTGSPQEMVPQGSQMGAERCQMGVRRDQIGAQRSPMGANRSPEGPKWEPRGSKWEPRGSKWEPRGSTCEARGVQVSARGVQMEARGGQKGSPGEPKIKKTQSAKTGEPKKSKSWKIVKNEKRLMSHLYVLHRQGLKYFAPQ